MAYKAPSEYGYQCAHCGRLEFVSGPDALAACSQEGLTARKLMAIHIRMRHNPHHESFDEYLEGLHESTGTYEPPSWRKRTG